MAMGAYERLEAPYLPIVSIVVPFWGHLLGS